MQTYPHRPGVDLWLCPCNECTRLEWEANDQPGRLSEFRKAHRAELAEAVPPEQGVTRCACGCKYWQDGRCVDCGERPLPQLATGRAEHEPCQRGTVGCCIDHSGPGAFNCETW